MAAKKGLGKGINTLIPEEYEIGGKQAEPVVREVVREVVKEVKVPEQVYLKLREIEPNRKQPRKVFDENALEELAESIRQYGVVQPLVVQKRDNHYEIIAGERRWRAAKQAGLKEVPVVIRTYSEQEMTEVSLIENIQREELNPIEEAMAYRRLIEEFHLKQEEVAKKVSKNRTTIANSLRLLKLEPSVQERLSNNILSIGHAKVLLEIEDAALQKKAADMVEEKELSVRETEKLVKSLLNPAVKKEKETLENEAVYRQIQERLSARMGTKVSVNRKSNEKGKIEIEYYSKEELERILELIGISQE